MCSALRPPRMNILHRNLSLTLKPTLQWRYYSLKSQNHHNDEWRGIRRSRNAYDRVNVSAAAKTPSSGVLPRTFTSSTPKRFQPDFDPHTYTQGRWLHRNEERQALRKMSFDFDALLALAVQSSPGAQRVVECEKLEGGFNRVFMIGLDNGKTVVARLPNRIAGPEGLTVGSEVATLEYVRAKTKVPVPKILTWSCTTENEVGAEYMIMDVMPGVSLSSVWRSMSASDHIACIHSLGHLSKELCSLDFPYYGALYLNTDRPQSSVDLDDTFCIGPLCARQHWGYSDSKLRLDETSGDDPGPWSSVDAYLTDLATRSNPSLPRNHKSGTTDMTTPGNQQTELKNVMQKTLKLIASSDIIKEAAQPTLFHPDFHLRNILVDPNDHTRITGLLDWQSAAIQPAFVYASETPDFAQVPEPLHKPEEDASSEANSQNRESKPRTDAEFCATMWAGAVRMCPKYREAALLDSTLLNFLASGSTGWFDNAVFTKSMLIDLSDDWANLGLPSQCPYQPSAAEREDTKQEMKKVEERQYMIEGLGRGLGCDHDGWVAAERWEEVLPVYLNAYATWRKTCEANSEEDEVDEYWPYDQR